MVFRANKRIIYLQNNLNCNKENNIKKIGERIENNSIPKYQLNLINEIFKATAKKEKNNKQ